MFVIISPVDYRGRNIGETIININNICSISRNDGGGIHTFIIKMNDRSEFLILQKDKCKVESVLINVNLLS